MSSTLNGSTLNANTVNASTVNASFWIGNVKYTTFTATSGGDNRLPDYGRGVLVCVKVTPQSGYYPNIYCPDGGNNYLVAYSTATGLYKPSKGGGTIPGIGWAGVLNPGGLILSALNAVTYVFYIEL